ncbi:hypothetical protein LTR56_016988 [Elasticomyces elasticus]|nr:hypothetical protein LTR56_016988 [Elasticomyces elasticus]KAK3636128.1 hypothetical protein LTR22_018886 [Elasticomyces elasticus]KAK4912103.1 hypothetical protein LTR49_019389 [Elasticomyces elasticus]KAK5753651.1 hypothetical protein LTS12_016288 [Elasticomyces elasticus]
MSLITKRTSRVAELAAEIQHHTALLDTYHEESGRLPLSFDPQAKPRTPYPADVERSRAAAVEASTELAELLETPEVLVTQNQLLVSCEAVFHRFIYEFDVARKVPLIGDISYLDLSTSIGVPEHAVKRMIKLAIANRIFCEARRGFVSHSAGSKVIAEHQYIRDYEGAYVEEIIPTSLYAINAMKKWPHADSVEQTGYVLSRQGDTAGDYWKDLGREPDRARRFAGMMQAFAQSDELKLAHVVDGFDWGAQGKAKIVDLGGSTGDTAFVLAERYPELSIVVQDLKSTLAGAKGQAGMDVTFMEHDFFDAQPVKNADIYFFRWIFHDWADGKCVSILKALIPALKLGARVVIMDAVLPQVGALPNGMERRVRVFDVMMHALFAARERELDDWISIFAEADERFILEAVRQPEGSRLSVMEWKWSA